MRMSLTKIKQQALLATAALCLLLPAQAVGGEAQPQGDTTFGEAIDTPVVPTKAQKGIRNHLTEIQQSLVKHNMQAQLIRNGEVVMVTLPCAGLFNPNETVLKESGKRYLRPFVDLLKYPTMYKVVVAVHSDATGEPAYLDALTEERANAIDAFLEQEAKRTDANLIPFGLGPDDPLVPNDSMENRSKNRRVEIYIVPEWQMIDSAKSGRLGK